MLVQQSTIGALERLRGTEDYSGSAGEALLVQKSTTVVLVRLCWYSRVL